MFKQAIKCEQFMEQGNGQCTIMRKQPFFYFNYANQDLLIIIQIKCSSKKEKGWAVVMAQLVERSPPSPEIRGSNLVIGKLLSNICLLSTVLKRRK